MPVLRAGGSGYFPEKASRFHSLLVPDNTVCASAKYCNIAWSQICPRYIQCASAKSSALTTVVMFGITMNEHNREDLYRSGTRLFVPYSVRRDPTLMAMTWKHTVSVSPSLYKNTSMENPGTYVYVSTPEGLAASFLGSGVSCLQGVKPGGGGCHYLTPLIIITCINLKVQCVAKDDIAVFPHCQLMKQESVSNILYGRAHSHRQIHEYQSSKVQYKAIRLYFIDWKLQNRAVHKQTNIPTNIQTDTHTPTHTPTLGPSAFLVGHKKWDWSLASGPDHEIMWYNPHGNHYTST